MNGGEVSLWLIAMCLYVTHAAQVADRSFKCHPLRLLAWPHLVPVMPFCYATLLNDGCSLDEAAKLHILRIIDN